MRTPSNTYGQEETDDYLGVILGCVLNGDLATLRSILWYGVRHFFVFHNTGPLSFKCWLGRFPQVWLLMFAAAFPWTKYLFYPVLLVISHFMTPVVNDQSGNILQYLYMYVLDILYKSDFREVWLMKLVPNKMKDVFGSYFSPEHPLTFAVKE
jgi:hypothetical protein